MVKYYGWVYLDTDYYDKWFIKKWEVSHDIIGPDAIVLHLYNAKLKQNKQITITSDSVLWGVVEELQKRYPGAIYWKTKKQRFKAMRKYG